MDIHHRKQEFWNEHSRIDELLPLCCATAA